MRIAMRCSFGRLWFCCGHRIAQGGGATRRLDDAVELDQHQFAGVLEDVAAEFGDQRLDDFGQKRRQPGKAFRFVAGKQPAVAGDQNRRESAPDAPFRDPPTRSSRTSPKLRQRWSASVAVM